MLQAVQPGIVVLPEERDWLLQEAEAADDLGFREDEVVDVLFVSKGGGGGSDGRGG